jgi:putative transposase
MFQSSCRIQSKGYSSPRQKSILRKTFQYRLFTTRLQSELLDMQLGEACRLYNAALQERRDAWKQRVSINYYTQANQLKEIRAAGDLGLANFSCCQDTLRRVNKTYEAFLSPCEAW